MTIASCQGQIKNPATATVAIDGNCEMCETSIEKAAHKKKISKADWNKDSKMAVITFDSTKTNLKAILKDIALAGYDNTEFLAPDEVYNNLPECCRYERKNKKPAMVMNQDMHDPTTAFATDNHQHDAMNNDNKEAPAGQHNNHQQTTTTAVKANQLDAVFTSYFSVKDALVKTDGAAASTNAKELQNAINAVQMDKLPMDVHMVWMKVWSSIKADAMHINENKEITHQREHFIRLSKNMYDLMKVAKLPGTVYYQYCPMANDGKGATWLSKESNIRNPYYGNQMLTCGSTTETLK